MGKVFDKWDKRFMEMAEFVSTWSSCARAGRSVGAVVVRDRKVLTTGYNGAPAGIKSCKDKGYCMRDKLGIPSGTQHEKCYAVHAEQNAIVQAAKMGVSLLGATLYCTHQPCTICSKIIINSGISDIIYKYDYPDEFAQQLLKEAKVNVYRYEEK